MLKIVFSTISFAVLLILQIMVQLNHLQPPEVEKAKVSFSKFEIAMVEKVKLDTIPEAISHKFLEPKNELVFPESFTRRMSGGNTKKLSLERNNSSRLYDN